MFDERWANLERDYEYVKPLKEKDKISKEDFKKIFEKRYKSLKVEQKIRQAIAKQFVTNSIEHRNKAKKYRI